MTVTAYVACFIFMAVATITILAVGTLSAAGVLHRRHPADSAPRPDPGRGADPVDAPAADLGRVVDEGPHHGQAA
jgi:hypothetical protein